MNTNIDKDNLNSPRQPKIFNQSEVFIEGWYWVLPSQSLGVGEVKSVNIFGKDLIVYRGKDKRAVILDAYCPHIGANLAEGKVEGNELRCVLHRWKFNGEGICVDVPVLDEPVPVKAKTWPAAENSRKTGPRMSETFDCVPEGAMAGFFCSSRADLRIGLRG